MIVVAIIGILAAVALPAYQDYIARSQAVEGAELLAGLKAPAAEYFYDRGLVPTVAALNAVDTGKYVATITGGGTATNVYTATFKGPGSAANKLNSTTIAMTFDTATNQFTWDCSGGSPAMPSEVWPKVCQ